jgi:hypothetical protein
MKFGCENSAKGSNAKVYIKEASRNVLYRIGIFHRTVKLDIEIKQQKKMSPNIKAYD